jgi:quinol monooxygenase YgiN
MLNKYTTPHYMRLVAQLRKWRPSPHALPVLDSAENNARLRIGVLAVWTLAEFTLEKMMHKTFAALVAACFAAALFFEISPARAAEETVLWTARFYAAPGREAEVETRFRNLVDFVREAEPAVTYRLYRLRNDPSVFLFYSVYPSQAAFDEHVKITIPAFQKKYGQQAEGLFARPSELEEFRAVVE